MAKEITASVRVELIRLAALRLGLLETATEAEVRTAMNVQCFEERLVEPLEEIEKRKRNAEIDKGKMYVLTEVEELAAIGKLINKIKPEKPGIDVVKNGGFVDNKDWVLGDGWSILDGQAVCDGSQVDVTALAQGSLKTGDMYDLSFEIIEIIAGGVRIQSGYDETGLFLESAGIHVIEVTAENKDLVMLGNADFIGKIDNVKAIEK